MIGLSTYILALAAMWAGIALPCIWLLFTACFLGGLSLGLQVHEDLAIALQNWRADRRWRKARRDQA